MRIKVINPNTTQSMTEQIAEAAKRYARPNTEIVALSPQTGPASIENFHDEYVAIIGVLEEIHKGKKENNDAYIIACYGDPGLYAAREITDAPVIGIAEASMYIASILAARFSIVTIIPRAKLLIEEVVNRYGMKEKCISIRTTILGVLDFENDPKKGMLELIKESRKAIKEDKAEAICLGCAGMAKFADDLESKLKVPVIDGVVAAVKLAEAIVDMKKTTSKILYFNYPEKKNYKGFDSLRT